MNLRPIHFTLIIFLAPIASLAVTSLPVTNLTRCYCDMKREPTKVTATCHPESKTHPVYFGTLSNANQDFHLKSQAPTEGSTAEAPLSIINGTPNSIASSDSPSGGNVAWTNAYALWYATHCVAVEGKFADMDIPVPVVINAKWINPLTCKYNGPKS